jgi:hypothetical protein
MGEVQQIIDTAWAHVKVAFTEICRVKRIPEPNYDISGPGVLNRLEYPALVMSKDYVRQETSAIMGEELQVALDLVLVHTAMEADALSSNGMAYIDAMLEMIRDDHTFGGACHIGEFVATDFFGDRELDQVEILKMAVLLRKEVQI